MKKYKLVVLLLTLLLAAALLFSACTQESTGKVDKPVSGSGDGVVKVSDEEVRKLFLDNCSGCHGANREGALGPALIAERLANISDDELKNKIINGVPGSAMPPWKGTLSEERIDALVKFIKSPVAAATLKMAETDIESTLEVLVDEETLPDQPAYEIRDLRDLMVVVQREKGALFVADGHKNEALKHIENTGYRTHVVVFDPASKRWLYTIARNGWVTKIDLYTLQPVRKVRVGVDSRGLAISDDGKYLMTGNYVPNSAVLLDAETLKPLKVYEARGLDPDGKEVDSRVAGVLDTPFAPYFVLALKEAGVVWIIDYSKPDFPIVAAIDNVGRILHDAFLTEPDGRYFMIASQSDNVISVIDLKEKVLVDKIPTGRGPHPGQGAVVKVNGRTLGFSPSIKDGILNVWDIETWKPVKQIKTEGPGLFVAGHPESKYVWTDVVFGANNDTIHVVDTETLEIVKTLKPGKLSVHPEFTYDGQYVYVSLWGENKVVVYDPKTYEIVKEFTGVTTPTGIFSGARLDRPGL